MKIAIISDLHLGYRQYSSTEREKDFYNQFYKVCCEINKCNPEMVIISGDLFNHHNPTPKAISAYRKGIGLLDTDLICVIKGNHTMVIRDEHYSIDEFFADEEIEGYYYLEDKSINTHDYGLETQYDEIFSKYINTEVYVDGITYRNNTKIDEFLKIQQRLAREKETLKGYKILVLHQAFKEYCGYKGERLSIEDINYLPYDVVICGHIHQRLDERLSDGTWFIQPGSIERMNTMEALDETCNGKGFYLLDTVTDNLKFHKVECDRKFIQGDVSIGSDEELEEHLNKLEETLKNYELSPVIAYDYNIDEDVFSTEYHRLTKGGKNMLLNKSRIHINFHNEDNNDDLDIIHENLLDIPSFMRQKAEDYGFNKEETDLMIELFEISNRKNTHQKDIVNEMKKVSGDYFKKHYNILEELL